MKLSLLDVRHWATAHGTIFIGLILVTIGIIIDNRALNIAGMWVFGIGICIGAWSIAHKIGEKKPEE